jgi:hypothetical protein
MGRRNRGRPKKRWIEDTEKDIQIMGIRGWRKLCKERAEWKEIVYGKGGMEENCVRKGRNGRKLCKERAEWKKITQKAKTHSGL